uniref:hypothetical protein n=1 Tax=Roseateles sp. TaxID=1971397 RepID=UPI00286B32CB
MATSKHLLSFEGGNALSAFRAQALLAQLQTVNERIKAVHARHVHWVWCDAALQQGDQVKLAALLNYGDAYLGGAEGQLVLVAPRLGTVSPWASKATDIAHNCVAALRSSKRRSASQRARPPRSAGRRPS